MPELPEVETASETAEEYLVNKTIVEASAVEDESKSLFLVACLFDGDDDGVDLDLSSLFDPSSSSIHFVPEIFAGASPASLRLALVGKKVTAVRRHGKTLWLELEQGGNVEKGGKGKAPKASSSSSSSSPSSSAALMLHFGMTGSFPVRGAKNVVYVSEGGGGGDKEDGKNSWPPRFCKIELSLSPGDVKVAYCDPRRFGRVQVVSPASAVPGRLPGGRDVLTDPLSPQDLAAALDAKVNRGTPGRALKTVLMEQAFLAGVGNWVADEVREKRIEERGEDGRKEKGGKGAETCPPPTHPTPPHPAPPPTLSLVLTFFRILKTRKLKKVLFAARIHPETRSVQLSEDQIARLSQALRSVVETACAARADSSLFPKSWLFHQRWDGFSSGSSNKKTHEGHRISWIKIGGRTTAFCPAIQRKTDDDGGEEGKEEDGEGKAKPKSKATAAAATAAAATATATASKRKQQQAPEATAPLLVPPPPEAAAKKARKSAAVPKATKGAARAPSARAKALPRI